MQWGVVSSLQWIMDRLNVKFNEGATLIVSGSYDSSVRLWDCRTRVYDPVQVLEEAKDSVTSLHLASSEILTGSVDGKWLLAQNQSSVSWPTRVSCHRTMSASSSADLPTEVAFELTGHQGAVRAVRFNRTGSYCLTCGSDRTVRLWNPHKGLAIKSYSGHGTEVLDADSSHDNSRIVSGGGDKTVMILDVGTGQPIRKFRGHISRINCVKFNEEATLIVSGSYDSSVRLWDCRARVYDPVQVLEEAKDSVTSLHLASSEILTGSVDGKVRRYDIRFGKLFTDTVGQPVTCVSYSRDGHCMLASSLDNKLRLFDKDSGEMLNEYKGHVNTDYKLDSCLSHDDSHVISGSEDGRVCFWDLVEGQLVHTLHVSKTPSGRPPIVYSLCWHPSKATLLTAGSHGPVRVWKPSGWRDEEEKEQ